MITWPISEHTGKLSSASEAAGGTSMASELAQGSDLQSVKLEVQLFEGRSVVKS